MSPPAAIAAFFTCTILAGLSTSGDGLRRGLGFDECDVGVLLNIASDHLGERDIHTLEELARCKAVGVDAAKRKENGGYCVLNADDPLVMEHGTYWARGEIIYFTMNPENPALAEHLASLGMVLTVKQGKIVMLRGKVTVEIVEVNEAIVSEPGKVNDDPEGDAWFFKIKAEELGQMDDYMDEAAYKSFIG